MEKRHCFGRNRYQRYDKNIDHHDKNNMTLPFMEGARVMHRFIMDDDDYSMDNIRCPDSCAGCGSCSCFPAYFAVEAFSIRVPEVGYCDKCVEKTKNTVRGISFHDNTQCDFCENIAKFKTIGKKHLCHMCGQLQFEHKVKEWIVADADSTFKTPGKFYCYNCKVTYEVFIADADWIHCENINHN
jgi:hypothetical protein